VIRDWVRSGLTGNYRPDDIADDLEAALSRYHGRVFALRNAHDRLVPRASLDWLLGKLRAADVTRFELGPGDYASARADHFSWMKDPAPVAERLAAWLSGASRSPP
jgi:predicted alpha/beta hydrolase